MAYLGNIVLENTRVKTPFYLKRCTSIKEIDESKPTLVVGLENARNYIKGFNILDKKDKENDIWWTFSKSERRSDYDTDLYQFIKTCCNRVIENTTFVSLNSIDVWGIKPSFLKIKPLLRLFKEDCEKEVYYTHPLNNYLYIRHKSNDGDIIYGIALDTAEFFGISPDRIKNFFLEEDNKRTTIHQYRYLNDIIDKIPNDIITSTSYFFPVNIIILGDYFD